MRLVVRFPTHRVVSCLGHYWWGQTRKWAHFAVKFPFAACFWYKNFWNIGRKCEIFWSQQPQIRERIGIWGHFSCLTQIFPKKSGVERATLHSTFFWKNLAVVSVGHSRTTFFRVYFFFFEIGPQWNIVNLLFFFSKKKQKKSRVEHWISGCPGGVGSSFSACAADPREGTKNEEIGFIRGWKHRGWGILKTPDSHSWTCLRVIQ